MASQVILNHPKVILRHLNAPSARIERRATRMVDVYIQSLSWTIVSQPESSPEWTECLSCVILSSLLFITIPSSTDCAWCNKEGWQCEQNAITGPDSKKGSRCQASESQNHPKVPTVLQKYPKVPQSLGPTQRIGAFAKQVRKCWQFATQPAQKYPRVPKIPKSIQKYF